MQAESIRCPRVCCPESCYQWFAGNEEDRAWFQWGYCTWVLTLAILEKDSLTKSLWVEIDFDPPEKLGYIIQHFLAGFRGMKI